MNFPPAHYWIITLAVVLGAGFAIGDFRVAKRASAQSEAAAGVIRLPDNFRRSYEFLGAWAVSDDSDTGGETGQHIVYASPGTVEAYRATGKFPDGAVLVKELFSGNTEDLTTGSATSAADVAGYFVMVKDTTGRNTGPLWGDGWGWAFFEADNTNQTTTEDYKAECLACHEPVRDRDLVYSYAYPVLKP